MAAMTLLAVAPSAAQQSSFQVIAASQIATGSEARLGGQHHVDPDLGFRLLDPGFRIGSLEVAANVTRRDDRAVVGRGSIRLDGVGLAGLKWSFAAGDVWSVPLTTDSSFANLFAPPVTYRGVSVSGRSAATTLLASAGRVTVQRSLFGTDNYEVGQTLYQASVTHTPSARVELSGHGAYLSGTRLSYYTPLVDRSLDVGLGMRVTPSTAWKITAEGGVSGFQRHGSPDREWSPSWLLGATWAGAHGSLQVNAQRFSIGRYPVVNNPYLDRSGLFALGELDLGSRARLFGGAEAIHYNLDELASERALTGVSPGSNGRAYGGVRLRLTTRSLLSVRVEGGNRTIRPSNFNGGFDSDTGVVTAEWRGSFGPSSSFLRYERRANVDARSAQGSFNQHDVSAQTYLSLKGGRQLFAQGLFSRRADRNGTGQTLWQAGGGAQVPMKRIYARVQATSGRTLDWASGLATNRIAVSAGLSGQLAPRLFLSVDCNVERSPIQSLPGSPWVTRTMIRLTRELLFGTSRARSDVAGESYRGPTGSVHGLVFVDWNGNGSRDADEEAVGGVAVAAGRARLQTGADGRFAFSGMPVGEGVLALDASTVPADFNLPPDAARKIGIVKNRVTTVEFGLAPVGAIQGSVYQDVDNDGRLGPGDQPVASAVVVLDDGARSELVRDGRFRFDNVGIGRHQATLLQDSLPEGSQIVGSANVDLALSRTQMTAQVVYLVKIEKRPEIRKVFPPKKLDAGKVPNGPAGRK